MLRKHHTLLLWASALLFAAPFCLSQTEISSPAPAHNSSSNGTQVLKMLPLNCPGGYPTDLGVASCSYTPHMRFEQWIQSSTTDEAMLGALIFGAVAQAEPDPGEWDRSWKHYGARVGARYTQSFARGTTEYMVGAIFHEDPRHISYAEDPHLVYQQQLRQRLNVFDPNIKPAGSFGGRTWHVVVDTVTVRVSQADGDGRRTPATGRFLGIIAGAFAGYPWYPGPENTPWKITERGAGAFGTTALGSTWHEFSPDITHLLGSAWGLIHKSKPKTDPVEWSPR